MEFSDNANSANSPVTFAAPSPPTLTFLSEEFHGAPRSPATSSDIAGWPAPSPSPLATSGTGGLRGRGRPRANVLHLITPEDGNVEDEGEDVGEDDDDLDPAGGEVEVLAERVADGQVALQGHGHGQPGGDHDEDVDDGRGVDPVRQQHACHTARKTHTQPR